MTAAPLTILVTTLAEYQTRFWIPVARSLLSEGQDVRFLAFDDRSAEMTRAAGIACVNMYRTGLSESPAPDDPRAFDERLRAYGINNPNLLFSHERMTFAIRDARRLARRFMIYGNAMERVLDDLEKEGRRCVLVQELGGFISVIASYFAARRRGIDNWFAEPAFFRGRLHFNRNTFAACPAMETPANVVLPELRRYLDDAVERQSIVVPVKDRDQYVTAFAKVLNGKNLRRLSAKLYDQYVLGKHQEFGHNLKHAWAHARMAWNALRMRGHYREPTQRFIYFPLHVPADMALTIRSPEFLDQIALVDYLLRVIPQSHVLAVKEHPAQIGAIPAVRLRQLLKRYDNLVVLPPKTNNYVVLGRADAVVSVNSKSGAEALLLGKPVLVLGDAFYSRCPLVFRVGGLSELAGRLNEALASGIVDRHAAVRYFQSAWNMSLPGELYATAPEHVAAISRSILKTVQGPEEAPQIQIDPRPNAPP